MNLKKIFPVMITLIIIILFGSAVHSSAQLEPTDILGVGTGSSVVRADNFLGPTAEVNASADTIYKYGFEYGWLGWWADNGVWQIGQDSLVTPHSGDSLAGTVLNGPYPDFQNSRLISPGINLPMISSTQALRLRFWHWFKFADDVGQVQISVDSAGVWQSWEIISNDYGGQSPYWTPAEVEISKYAGKRVRFGFYLLQGWWGGTDWGWYVDDVCVIKTPACVSAPVCFNFENGWGDWWGDNGVWEVGHPDSVVVPHSGQNCAATILNNNYPDFINTRLVSPVICLPNIDPGNEGLYSRFWHWFKFADDVGQVQISVDSAGNWQPWETISNDFTGISAVWSPYEIEISKYAGKRVRFGFYLLQGWWGGTDWGWYVDDVCVATRRDSVRVLVPNGGECWELGQVHTVIWYWQNWSGTFQNVKIELSRDAGKTWETLDSCTSNNGFWQGIITGPVSDRCLIKISDCADGIPSDVSDSFFTIGEVVTVTSPNGGEIWPTDTTCSITWTSSCFTDKIKLEYSTNSGGSWITILDSTANDSSEPWVIPNTPSKSCLVRISDVADSVADTSDSLFTIGPGSGVSDDQKEKEFTFSLAQNFPNPFNPNTFIQFSLPVSGKISLKIYNLLGQEVKTLIDEEKRAGEYEVLWDGKDNFGEDVASGIYFYRVAVGDFSETRKLVLLK
jgi:hypothetical protein